MPSIKIAAALPAVAFMAALAGCQSVGPTVNTGISDVLSYACPLAAGIEVSALSLSPSEQAIVNTAVADCNEWEANPSMSWASPTAVAQVLVQAAIIIQQNISALPASSQAKAHLLTAKLHARGLM